jgi:hypothetical protein
MMTKHRSIYVSCTLCAALVFGCTQESDAAQTASPATTMTGGSSAPPIMEEPPVMQEEPPDQMPNDSLDPTPAVDEEPSVDAGSTTEPTPTEPAWEPLITADWELAEGDERYFCQRVTLTQDVYFSAIRAINPLGTHHTALTAEPGAASAPDGLTECDSGLSPQGIFGSGPGTDPVFYPDGVGLKLRAGQQLLLNLHVFNAGEGTLRGTSGAEIVKTTPDAIEHVAESVLAGPTRLNLPAGEETTVSGRCTMTQDTTLFAVQPHMHQLGIHMRGVAESSIEGTKVLHDGAFKFDEQLVYSIEPVQMSAGDVVSVECTFNNTTEALVNLGESSKAEMCFLVLHRYPAADNPAVTCFF